MNKKKKTKPPVDLILEGEKFLENNPHWKAMGERKSVYSANQEFSGNEEILHEEILEIVDDPVRKVRVYNEKGIDEEKALLREADEQLKIVVEKYKKLRYHPED